MSSVAEFEEMRKDLCGKKENLWKAINEYDDAVRNKRIFFP